MKFTASCIQFNAKNNMAKNIARAGALVEIAAQEGAQFVALPENFAFMAGNAQEYKANLHTQENHPAIPAMQALAKQHKIWLLLGSVSVALPGDTRAANRSLLINPKGKIAATYDKIHLYDAKVTGGESHRESDRIRPGNKAVVASLPWGKIGLTICYDLRFPQLYRTLAKDGGASLLSVPAAFTYQTGKAHWHELLRARAIEEQCFVIAPAMVGNHPANRRTYGHSLIIDPWGKVLADAGGRGEKVITAEIDMQRLAEVREQIPCLEHDRKFSL